MKKILAKCKVSKTKMSDSKKSSKPEVVIYQVKVPANEVKDSPSGKRAGGKKNKTSPPVAKEEKVSKKAPVSSPKSVQKKSKKAPPTPTEEEEIYEEDEEEYDEEEYDEEELDEEEEDQVRDVLELLDGAKKNLLSSPEEQFEHFGQTYHQYIEALFPMKLGRPQHMVAESIRTILLECLHEAVLVGQKDLDAARLLTHLFDSNVWGPVVQASNNAMQFLNHCDHLRQKMEAQDKVRASLSPKK